LILGIPAPASGSKTGSPSATRSSKAVEQSPGKPKPRRKPGVPPPGSSTTLISSDSSGNAGNSLSETASISADGRFIAFASLSSNLVTGDTNNNEDVFVKDTLTGITTAVSNVAHNCNFGQSNCGGQSSSISADGR